MRFGVRFWPPLVPLDPDVEWVLRAAFGALDVETATDQPKEEAVRLEASALRGYDRNRRLSVTRQLGLLRRILGLRGPGWSDSASPELKSLQASHRRACEAETQRCERMEQLVDRVAEPLRISYALLDGSAMHRHVPNVAARRSFSALHILVHEHDVQAFLDGLRKCGRRFRASSVDDDGMLLQFEERDGVPDRARAASLTDDGPRPRSDSGELSSEHDVDVPSRFEECDGVREHSCRAPVDGAHLGSELGGEVIHVHTRIPHVRMIPGGDEVTMQHLLDSHRTDRVEALSEFAHLPGADLILAHVMARGIAQYGYLPRRFPLMSMLADAVDLDFYDNTTRATQALWWLQPDVNFHEVTALRDVAQCVRAGDIAAMWSDEGRNGRMLRHLVLSSLDNDYASGLLPFEAIYRVLELKNDGLSLATLTRAKTAFAGIQASIGRQSRDDAASSASRGTREERDETREKTSCGDTLRRRDGTREKTSCGDTLRRRDETREKTSCGDTLRGRDGIDSAGLMNEPLPICDSPSMGADFEWSVAAKDVITMLPRAAGMHARQWKALVLLILGKRLL
ncbi:MAG TPA: hypothetical protein VKP30_02405 [Polyangiaceae bacterium]|nr:hypothetical protein [Polyangiaceae bacterium]